MIKVDDFGFKASYFEYLNFKTQNCAFPNPVDIWINGHRLIDIFSQMLPPKKEKNNPYRTFTPFSAELYKENLQKEDIEVPIFFRTPAKEKELPKNITVDIQIKKDVVIWKNWKYSQKNIQLPEFVFDKKTYQKALKTLNNLIKRKPKELITYIPVDDALWLFLSEKNFAIEINRMSRYRRVQLESLPLKLDVDEDGEVVFCEWDLATFEKYPAEVIEKEIKYLMNECGIWIPGRYKLGELEGSFWTINYLLINMMKNP
ncbi:MAG: hypothetical protein GXO22_02855 [Aquificae bacterium]|nr:hypothetical protein [Aquificota bacterium]